MIKQLISIFIFINSVIGYTQSCTIQGFIKNSNGTPIEGVSIIYKTNGTTSNAAGFYSLKIKENDLINLTFSHIAFETLQKRIKYIPNKTINFSPTLQNKVESMDEVVVIDKKNEAQGVVKINALHATKIPGANQGVETLLMTLPGVSNSNELSTQYNVRGGNFDENLVYVNGIEVYRPFLVRSGQQEGLSFVNPNLVQDISFSAGGFQAKYGDKLASVLDITYKTPKEFAANANASLLGGNVSVEGTLLKNKLSALLGVRYRNNSLFINSKDIETNANPNFTDVQTLLSYEVNPKLSIDFLGNFSLNNYNYTPKSRRTKFGSIANPQELIVFYEGQEKDQFKTAFGAFKFNYKATENLNLHLITSSYQTTEHEHYDILASYNLSNANSDLGTDSYGSTEFSEGIGNQLNHARNNLDALIGNIEFKGNFKKNNAQLDFGLKYQYEDIRDRLIEWEMIDSVGFSVRPSLTFSNNQPYEPFTGELVAYQNINAKNEVTIDRLVWFAQYSKKTFWNNHKIWYNLGVRSHNWNVHGADITTSNKIIYSLRGQFSIKPDWDKDMLFRVSAGMYNQPPFYKELRNSQGNVVPDIEAQKSIQVVLGNDYSFEMWDRPFKLVSEIYYKNLTNLNRYTVDNVKVRYQADNNAKGYATGLDIRLNGEFVPGTESWVSLGLLKTEENYNDLGYIARPTDQRFKFGMLFQDYVPNIPNIRMYLNLVFNSGLPGGSPSYTDPYNYQKRLNSYKRADIGISYVFTDATNIKTDGWLKNFKELAVGFEIFNMFDVTNSITNTWVRDVYSKQFYGIPNYMTPRVFNVKMDMKF